MARHQRPAPTSAIADDLPGPETIDASDKDARIEYLADLMVRGLYVTRRTSRELSEVWGISYRTIENDASDASRLIRIGPEKRDEWRAQQQAYCAALREEARKTMSTITGMPDFGAVARFVELEAKFAGVDLGETEATQREPLEIRIVDAEDHSAGEAAESGDRSADPE
jgi:hypothetical protein